MGYGCEWCGDVGCGGACRCRAIKEVMLRMSQFALASRPEREKALEMARHYQITAEDLILSLTSGRRKP